MNEKPTVVSPTTSPPTTTQRQLRNITNLPPELILEIASYLHPVDRICLSLTCKPLLRATLPTLRITTLDFIRFHDRRYSYTLPQRPTLYTRLAHGWVPKDKYRYCCRCYKILPRTPEYFWQRLRRKKSPRYRTGLGVTDKEWRSKSKKARYKHLVESWCHSPEEDSSSFFCRYCYYRERDRTTCSMHCPLCLETDLTWSPPRQPWVRRTLCRVCKNLFAPFEWIAYCLLFCCVWSVKFVWDQGWSCYKACAGACCSR